MENATHDPIVLVSVLIPVRNGASFISEAISSCLAQNTSSTFEVLVVNDSSSDNTLEILQIISRMDSRVKVLENEGVGVGDALQTGLLHSKAEYIVRLDADDRMLPDRIEKQIAFLQSDHNVVLCGSQIKLFGEGRIDFSPNSYPKSHEEICQFMQTGNAFADPSVAFRRKAAIEVGGFSGSLDGAEQYHLWLRLSKVGGLVNLKEVLTDYRVHQHQFTKSKILKVVTQTIKVQSLWFLGITQFRVRIRAGIFHPLKRGVGRARIPMNLVRYLVHSLVAWIRS